MTTDRANIVLALREFALGPNLALDSARMILAARRLIEQDGKRIADLETEIRRQREVIERWYAISEKETK